MKRLLYLLVFLILFLSTPVLSSFVVPAVSAAPPSRTVVSTVAPTPTKAPARVEYALPYPGMLPDNPLYVLKNLRDKIIELLISNPVNKAEFYLLQADKKLSMGLSLSSMGKREEANEILTQSLIARTQAVALLESAIASGRSVPPFVIEKLQLSLAKHKEVFADFKLNLDTLNALITKAQQMMLK